MLIKQLDQCEFSASQAAEGERLSALDVFPDQSVCRLVRGWHSAEKFCVHNAVKSAALCPEFVVQMFEIVAEVTESFFHREPPWCSILLSE